MVPFNKMREGNEFEFRGNMNRSRKLGALGKALHMEWDGNVFQEEKRCESFHLRDASIPLNIVVSDEHNFKCQCLQCMKCYACCCYQGSKETQDGTF